jgi:hypothetical protein
MGALLVLTVIVAPDGLFLGLFQAGQRLLSRGRKR